MTPIERLAAGFRWTPENVSAREQAAASIRAYIERRQLRDVLSRVATIDPAADVGCGFGRLVPVLLERGAAVTGFEREAEMVRLAQRLLPRARFEEVATLAALPVPGATFAFAMTFTVLQHMGDAEVVGVVAELKRIVRPGGHILLVEETDAGHAYVDRRDRGHFTIGRSVAEYEALMEPCRLIHQEPRRVEPGFAYKGQERATVGDYLLFEVPPSSDAGGPA